MSDLDAARAFYTDTLGLQTQDSPGGYVLRAGGDTVAYLLEVGDAAGSAAWPVASFHVDQVAPVVATLRDRGVAFLGDDDLPFDLDESGVADQGDMAVAWMRDPDGNVLTVFSTGPQG